MVDSTNPRVMADNIRSLSARTQANAGAIEALGNYSTDEIDTGKKWIDDSTIYRKIFHVEELTTNSTIEIEHGITNLGVAISAYGFAQIKGANAGRSLPFTGAIYFTLTATKFNVIITSGYTAAQEAFIVFEYTKSASPSPNLAPVPNDTRSIEPEIREEIPEEEPIEAEPIEEPVVEVKKTTRKKTTTTD